MGHIKIGVKIDPISSIWYQNFWNLLESLVILENDVIFLFLHYICGSGIRMGLTFQENLV